MDFKIQVGEYEVIQHGVVHPRLDEHVHFFYDSLELDIFFTNDDEDTTARITPSIRDEKLYINVINFKNAFGTASERPFRVFSHDDGRAIYLSLFVQHIGDGSIRSVSFTFLQKTKDNNG